MSERIIPYKEPEVVLKKRKKKQKSLDKSIANDIKNKIKTKSKSRGKVYKRAEKFVKEYLSKEKFEVQISRRAKRANVYEIPNVPTLIFAIRISTPLESHSKVADVLNLLRLNSFNTGVFLKLNKTTLHLLKLVEPYVTWGTPSLNSIRQMIMKRGHIKTEKGHLPLTDNKLVEDALGEQNIICIEDIIHEIATIGPHFKDVNALIWHVKLNPPTKGWKKSVRPFGKGGDFGSRGDKINSLLQTMI